MSFQEDDNGSGGRGEAVNPEPTIRTLTVAAINDQLKEVEQQLLSTDTREHLSAVRRLHACIGKLTFAILFSMKKGAEP
jgi:5-enolpyruvylshikimate-3-phosphate synthase